MNENQDLLDLCRLNQMEEKIENSHCPEPGRSNTLGLLENKRGHLAKKIINDAPKISSKGINET